RAEGTYVSPYSARPSGDRRPPRPPRAGNEPARAVVDRPGGPARQASLGTLVCRRGRARGMVVVARRSGETGYEPAVEESLRLSAPRRQSELERRVRPENCSGGNTRPYTPSKFSGPSSCPRPSALRGPRRTSGRSDL